jgi:dTDP-4-amino-4,6-dideoxygalactose transaminase
MRILLHIDYLNSAINNPENDSVLLLCKEKSVEAWVLPSAIPSLYENLKQNENDSVSRKSIQTLLKLVSIFPMSGKDVEHALAPGEMNFSETLTVSAAESLNIEAIVTLDPQKFSSNKAKVLTPNELTEQLKNKKTEITKVPMLDIPASYHECIDTIEHEMMKVLRSSHFVLGSHVEEFETKAAEHCGVDFAIGVSSGTDALLVSLMAMEIGPGDEVITTPYTFFATMGSILRTGAKPVFVDIDPDTFNIDPDKIEKAVTINTKAILPVHLYGQCADMEIIQEIADRLDLFIIEDAAQAIGAEYKNQKAGSLGHAGCFSFYPTKNLGGFGDGGMVTVSSDSLRDKIVSLRNHGSQARYMHTAIGGNFRLDALQAAALSVRIDHLRTWNERRRSNAENYNKLFEKNNLSNHINIPAEKTGRHVYHQYVIRVLGGKRNDLKDFLSENNIGCAIYYPVPLHLQDCIEEMGYKKGDFPIAEQAAEETLALPISHEVTEEQINYIVSTIKKFYS